MTKLEKPQAFWAFLYKMADRCHIVYPIDANNHRVLVIWDLNGYGEYEFDWCICDKVMACTNVGVRRRLGSSHIWFLSWEGTIAQLQNNVKLWENKSW